MSDEPICECGHGLAEHYGTDSHCTLRSCGCFHFRAAPSPEGTPETIPPALSESEWRDVNDSTDEQGAASADVVSYAFLGRFHAAAAIALHRLPFGFTHEDVTALRESAEDDHAAYTHYDTLRRIAAKIEALLPPH